MRFRPTMQDNEMWKKGAWDCCTTQETHKRWRRKEPSQLSSVPPWFMLKCIFLLAPLSLNNHGIFLLPTKVTLLLQRSLLPVCMHVCWLVCLYVCICTYVCLYVWRPICICIYVYNMFVYIYMYVCMHACMYACI